MRELLFRSPFLKDVGRLRDGFFLCSAIKGPGDPVKVGTPDLVTADGHRIFYDTPLDIAKHSRAEVIGNGNTNVVLSPDIFGGFNRPPMLFSSAIVDRAGQTLLRTNARPALNRAPDIAYAGRTIARDGMLYFYRLLRTVPDCVMTGISIDVAVRSERSIVIGACCTGVGLGVLFSGTILYLNRRRRACPAKLRRAVRDGDLSLVYQPLIDLDTGAVVGCEALTRWRDEDGTAVRPDVFIALAEDHGFISEITRFVFRQALSELSPLLIERPGFHVSINVTASDLVDPEFVPLIDRMIEQYRVPYRSIGLELTERSTADREHLVKTIRQLRERGLQVYIDDFGTGYSSLSYLHELELDFVKIDRVFASTIGTESVARAHSAEDDGAGNRARAAHRRGRRRAAGAGAVSRRALVGIHAQGFWFSQPMPAEDLLRLLAGRDVLREYARKV